MVLGPLTGFTIGVTADRRAEEQMQLLEGRGAECVHAPTIRTHALGPQAELKEATERVLATPPAVVVFTTGIGMRGWMEAADAMDRGDELKQILDAAELYTRGPKATGATVTAGFSTTFNAPSARSEEVVDALADRGVDGVTVAVQLDGAPAADMQERVASLGALVIPVPVYRWSLPDDPGPAERLLRAICERRVDAVTFTSRPAVENLFVLAGELDSFDRMASSFAEAVTVSCVGDVCAGPFEDLPGVHPVIPHKYRLGAQVQSLTRHLAERHRDIEVGDARVRLQGRAVISEHDDPILLSDRESDILAVLSERPGVVYSKRDLLNRVWGDEGPGDHIVEVTVGRLRGRLGDIGLGIETVMRRGYRLATPL